MTRPLTSHVTTGFAGINSVIHLALDDTGVLDVSSVVALVEHLVAAGVHGLTVNGLASESWLLDEAERDTVCELVVSTVAGRLPVVSGVDGGTADAVTDGARALALGATALMVRPPKGMPVADLPRHYRTVADELDVDLLVQDARADAPGLLTADEVLRVLDDHPRLRWVKVDEPSAQQKVTRLVAGGAHVVTGWGGLRYPEAVRSGAHGCMPGADLAPALVRLDALLRAGSDVEAEALYATILPLLSFEAQSLSLLIAGAKLALTRRGVFRSARLREGELPSAVATAQLEAYFADLERAGVPGVVTTPHRPSLPEHIGRGGIVAIVRRRPPAEVLPLLMALADAGVEAVEVTADSERVLESLASARSVLGDDVAVGAGTVRSQAQAAELLSAGAQFLVCPHTDLDLVAWCADRDVPVLPGALTPTEVRAAWDAGAAAVKLFPAGSVGPGYLQGIRGPLPDVLVVPTGGVTADNAAAWFEAGAVAVGVGSWLTGSSDLEVVSQRAGDLIRAAGGVTSALRPAPTRP